MFAIEWLPTVFELKYRKKFEGATIAEPASFAAINSL